MKKRILLSWFVTSLILMTCNRKSMGPDEIYKMTDTAAEYIGDMNWYDILVKNKNGCDGIVTVEFVVEKDGTVSNAKCLGAMGKTNCKVGLWNLEKLKKWKPATVKNQKVRSLVKLQLHT